MRFDKKTAVEDMLELDISRLKARNVLLSGSPALWTWWRGGRPIATITIKASFDAIQLDYRADGQPQCYSIQLTETPCHYGGTRKWFLCPAIGCGRRVAKLYGGSIFACRHCHALNYTSQQCNKSDIGLHRSRKLRQRLGCDKTWAELPACLIPRRKGKHWKTHTKEIETLKRYDEQAASGYMRYHCRLRRMIAAKLS